ncbi:unnamed protein product [Victoria cruziana]
MSVFLRRTLNSSSTHFPCFPTITLTAMISSGTSVRHAPAAPLSGPSPTPSRVPTCSPFAASDTAVFRFDFRGFRSCPGVLSFCASVPASMEYAVADLSDEDRPSATKGGEGLEIAKLGISQDIVSALAKRGITKLFPIQRAVLEPAMQGRDMIGRAKTGTGKTLAFGIPIMDRIIRFNAKHGRGRNPLALVMAPTRELARQVEKEFRESAPVLDTICVYGGVPISSQMRTLDYGVDIVVGTPGRIIDLLKRGALNLSEVQFVVLDEADQMLAVGFDEDVEVILEKLPQNRQSMMFSATMPSWIRRLSQKYLNNPFVIDLVIHYELPNTSEIFVHRSGRTGRAGKKGSAILMHTEQQNRAVRIIERDVGCKFNELPRVSEERSQDMFTDAGGGCYRSSFGGSGGGRLGGPEFGRFGGCDGSRFGSSRFGGSSSGRFGGYVGSGSGHASSFDGRSSGRYGGFGGSSPDPVGRSTFGPFDRFGNSGSSRSGGSFKSSNSSRSGGVSDFGSSRLDDSGSSHFGSFGRSNGDLRSGRRSF